MKHLLRVQPTNRSRLAARMPHRRRHGVTWKSTWLILGLLSSFAGVAKNLMYAPDGRILHIKGGTFQPDLSMYRSPLESKIVDRRFYSSDGTYMANEGFKTGMEGLDDFVKSGMPVAFRRAFQWVIVKEAYFYARYVLDYTGARGHAGIHMVHGPYFTMLADRLSHYNRTQRNRGERKFSNKDVVLGFLLPMVYQRVGFPRVFDDVGITYLQYKSVDPHFTTQVDGTDDYYDPMSGKRGGWGVGNAFINDYRQRYDHDKMDTTFDMGAIGQFVKRRMQWSDYFFHSEHQSESAVSMGNEVTMLGNDAEEGMRGWGITLASTNTLLQVKAAMFTDGKRLLGINPADYNPAHGLRYIPHEITPNILLAGDLPERLYAMRLKDNSSQLWDQASWIWGATAYATTVQRRPKVFTDNPPVDGGFVEKGMGLVAEAMANTVFRNMQVMHTRDDILVSEWTPEHKTGDRITLRDMMMSLVALHDMEQGWQLLDKYEDTVDRITDLMDSNARFLVKVQRGDGAFYPSYRVPDGTPIGEAIHGNDQWAAIRALLAAYFSTEETDYLVAARKTFNLLNSSYWIESKGVYRSSLGDDSVVVTPYSVGVTMGAMREMMFATPAYKTEPQIERFTRWWIQTLDVSGAQQSESQRTGEVYSGLVGSDDDGDGIPFAGKGDGPYGIAAMLAGKTVINVGGASNHAFAQLDGQRHNPDRFKKVRMHYLTRSKAEQNRVLLPLKFPREPGVKARDAMERVDGTLIPLQPSKPIKLGLGTVLGLTGQQIFEANCTICHGQHGEGIDGLPLAKDIDRSHDGMFKIVNAGRVTKFMPPWGAGNADGFGGALTKAEIDKIVDYVQSDGFRSRNKRAEDGQVVEGAWPKDVWFYLSRENAKAHGTQISGPADAMRYYKQHEDPAAQVAPWNFNILRHKPDADLTMADAAAIKRMNGGN